MVNGENGFDGAAIDRQQGQTVKRYLVRSLALAIAATPFAAAAQPATSGSRIEFVDPMVATTLAQKGHDLSPLGMFAGSGGVVKSVIVLLLLASLLTWTVGVKKAIELRRERRRLHAGVATLHRAGDLSTIGDTGYGPLADMVVAAEDEIAASARSGAAMPAQGIKDRIALRLDRHEAALRRQAGRSIGILAIVGSTGPFVGLAGTVWGIMNSFIGIAQSHTTNLAVVAPGIAEALLTTAIGLIAAIPAVVLYNIFARILSTFAGEVGDAGAAILCLAAREVDRAEAGR